MTKVPSAVWIVDTKKEHIAVGEARKLNIPVVAILDTNCDPDEVDYKIPGNDDAIRSAALLTRVVADAVAEGLRDRAAQAANAGRDDKPEAGGDGQLAADEPMPEWERDLLAPAGGDCRTRTRWRCRRRRLGRRCRHRCGTGCLRGLRRARGRTVGLSARHRTTTTPERIRDTYGEFLRR